MSNKDQADINALGFASIAEGLQANFKRVEEIMADFTKNQGNLDLDPLNLNKAYTQWLTALQTDPQKVIQANMTFFQNSLALSQQIMSSFTGQQADPVVAPEKADRRFKHDDWSEQPVFNAIKQSYLLTSQYMRNLVSDVEGLDEHTAEKVKFYTERYIDAMSPTNFAATNPAVIEKVIETKGANLVHGLKNMLEDLEAGNGQLKIRMTDTDAFTLGENVAVTPGKVIYQNRMFQLIQYTPTTGTVLKRPLLIVPPWINKFYIMDLQEKNSLLKWMVDQGHTVFVISWVNPDETYAEVGFEEYVKEGVITATDVVEQTTGESEINAIGYCIGGTLLTTTLAYMKQKGDNRIKSATFFTTMLDFSDPGELGIFIDDEQVDGIEKKMSEEGYLCGSSMSGVFNLMRANDLIWSFYVNNYLLGNDPRPFDLLYWNSDSTRMPAKMHSWYLRNMYLNNKLCQPGGVSVDGVDIDISSIDIPVCFVSAIEDHIAPWKSNFAGAKLFSGDVRFILGNSGHIAGIINPPIANKYGYRVTDELPEDEDVWALEAELNEGSWWPEWNSWIRPLSNNEEVSARAEGCGVYEPIENAPGTYVQCKSDEPTPVLKETKQKPKAKPAKKVVKATAVKKVAAEKPVEKKASAAAPTKEEKVGAKTSVNDDLTLIKGVGTKVAESLIQAGINNFGQIAEMTAQNISDALVKIDKRNQRFDTSTWAEQAAKLLKK